VVEDWVERFLTLPSDALRLQKALLTRWRRVDLDTAVALSADVFARAYSTGEPRRAMQAFFDRRAAARRPGA
jgi:enoyl-CoA hydratase/carnithine racemase